MLARSETIDEVKTITTGVNNDKIVTVTSRQLATRQKHAWRLMIRTEHLESRRFSAFQVLEMEMGAAAPTSNMTNPRPASMQQTELQ